jgi:hypothetical protein
VIELDEIYYRKMAVKFAEHACNGSRGRGFSDPVYRLIASKEEDRKMGRSRDETAQIQRWQQKFSGCAFLCHWMLECLGIKLPWVGREKNQPLSRLCWPPAPAKTPGLKSKFEGGDILAVWNLPSGTDAHVMVVIDHLPSDGVLLTADYGQPGGGALRNRNLSTRWSATDKTEALFADGRQIKRWLPLMDALRLARDCGALGDVSDPTLP